MIGLGLGFFFNRNVTQLCHNVVNGVYLSVLKNCTLVQGIVKRFNMLYPSNDRQSRRSRRRILSELSLDLTLEFINALGLKLPLLPRHKKLLPGTEVC